MSGGGPTREIAGGGGPVAGPGAPSAGRLRSGPRSALRGRGGTAALATVALVLGLVAGGCAGSEPVAGGEESARPLFDYEPPKAGTYALPPIQEAADGRVLLAERGEAVRLHELMGDRYVILAFVYTHCAAARGCPFAMATFHRLRGALDEDPELGREVRLATLSFDPVRDDLERMRSYADTAGVGSRDPGWVFLTTSGAAALDPILEGYGQYVVPEIGPDGAPTGQLSHVLKVFLIDKERRVRNIYSADFLRPELVLNDVRTLILEDASRRGPLSEIAR